MALLSANEVDAGLAELHGWERAGEAIRKTFRLRDFIDSVGFVDRLVEPAEEMGHHPDVAISWNRVTVSLTTHSEGGLTHADLDLARRIEALA